MGRSTILASMALLTAASAWVSSSLTDQVSAH
jgi:hypothetical protein